MSRRDKYHYIVKNALITEGWQITHDPYSFASNPELSTDLGAERVIAATRQNHKIAVEIKSFLTLSQVVDMERAIGQFVIYRGLLKRQEPDRELYLAVPSHAFEDIFSGDVGQVAITESNLKLLVYTLNEGETLQWIP